MNLTASQRLAVTARGNVLVSAGAGTGKTRTLVERCLSCLLQESPPASIDEILMVTFTEAAAAEMRQRIRERLEQEKQRQPTNPRWQEQLALFETAHIGTLHSFCFQLVRQHFYEAALDPQLSVLAEDEARLLADETLDQLLQRHYAGETASSQAVQRLIQVQGGGWDKPIRARVLQLHHFTQALPNPAAWLAEQLAQFATLQPVAWRSWWQRAAAEFPGQWLSPLQFHAPSNGLAEQCLAALVKLPTAPSPAELADLFTDIRRVAQNCPRGKKALWAVPLDDFFAAAEFLGSLLPGTGANDPLEQDWNWVREHMTALLQLAIEFSQSFSDAKRELGVLDFQDLEQYSLRLLWDPAANQPTAIARQWRDKLRFIFVDEYQDINAAQDKIIQALARDHRHPNRFLVGDIKQSIYRFRLANPKIFRSYAQLWSQSGGSLISLADNFRAREGLLYFINSVFGQLATPELDGLDYGKEAALRFGAPEKRVPLSIRANPTPAVELHLLLKTDGEIDDDSEDASEHLIQISELLEAEKEARLVGLRLRELQSAGHPVWDEQSGQFRSLEWRDIVILLRSPANKAESYAKELARLDIPLHVARLGFYQSLEISDLVSLLEVLDNPLQDLPLLVVLHSPLVGLTARELAEIRLAAPKIRFWNALLRWHSTPPAQPTELQLSQEPGGEPRGHPETRRKVELFFERYSCWRHLARQACLSQCLEAVLAETHYHSWLLTQRNGAQRYANVQRLLAMAEEFDQFQRQGLFRFLSLIQARQSGGAEPEVPAVAAENAVRLMSIHQSKGLEFPVVVLADLGKRFNLADLNAEIILDEQFGLCPQIKPPHTGQRYPSLAHWLGRRRHLEELLGEELRLLYVAFTRARDTLILTSSVTQSRFSKVWATPAAGPDVALRARCYADWLGSWFSQNVPATALNTRSGETQLLCWFIHNQSRLLQQPVKPADAAQNGPGPVDFASESWRQVERRLSWQYPFGPATEQPTKTSVSALRQQATLEIQDEASAPFSRLEQSPFSLRRAGSIGLNAAEIGSAHHLFLQLVSLEQTENVAALRAEAERLVCSTQLTPDEARVLDFDSLARFWASALGKRIRAQSKSVQRELPFTVRFAPAELDQLLARSTPCGLANEFVLVQGVADLVVIRPDEIWLVDFKTDQLRPSELAERVVLYKPQIELYSLALSRIYLRPVSESWLHFLYLQESVCLQTSAAMARAPSH
ncbi:MAG TPA: UvrD-helicase domain-containing protein [Verrucomicrobiae bacterium]|nr:UvrD-helicase domain-containing protein [Verrucomicrobiae bacterium]